MHSRSLSGLFGFIRIDPTPQVGYGLLWGDVGSVYRQLPLYFLQVVHLGLGDLGVGFGACVAQPQMLQHRFAFPGRDLLGGQCMTH